MANKTTGFIPSKFQQDVFDHITNSSENAIIDAVAGSGKSTTLIKALRLIPEGKSVLFLAFNKSIVEELKIKIGIQPNVEIRTLHSLGMNMIRTGFTGFKKVDADKYKSFLNKSMKAKLFSWNVDDEDFGEYKKNIYRLIDLIRVNKILKKSEALNMALDFGLNLHDNEIDIAFKCIKWGRTWMDTMDFTDMIYLPLIHDVICKKYDYVFIDECQDLNRIQRELFLKCLKPEGRFIAVGDPKQAIYGFAGADIKSFNILRDLPRTKKLPLSVCYRCDQDIINLASNIVPQITSRDGAAKGIVNSNASITELKEGDMVLCRLTFPLAKLCIELIKEGRKAHIKGRDMAKNLIQLASKGKSSDLEDLFWYHEEEINKIAFKIMKSKSCDYSEATESMTYINYEDNINTLKALSEGLTQSHELISRIETIFSDNCEGITLSTIHRSKGLESERVFILCPEFLMFPKAMEQEWSREQEENLVYVAYTRAKHYLGFIQDFDPMQKEY